MEADQHAESVRDWEATAIGLAEENAVLRKLLDDAINGCSMEWLIEGLLHIDGRAGDGA